MKKNKLNNLLLLILSLIFSVGLMFAFIELPVLLDKIIGANFGFPGFDQNADQMSSYKSELFIDNLYLRWIGYGSLILIILLIVIGFATRKSGWAFLGAFALFIPVFGQFALSMFFLAGLSILRVGWLPFMDISFNILDLGDIIFLPYELLMSFFALFNWNAHNFLSYFLMGFGSFLFVWGVLVWMRTRFGTDVVATSWIYKFSRHPQYLGWIIWSYGLVLYSNPINLMKKSWSVSSSLPWLLSTMIIIGICLLEEIKMKEEGGESYDNYRKNTPFLFPLPKWLKRIFNYPVKLLSKNDYVEKRSDVFKVTAFYTILLVLLSLPRIDFSSNQNQIPITTSTSSLSIDSLVNVIKDTNRRTYSKQFDELVAIGDKSVPTLIKLLNDEDPDIREFAAISVGKLKAVEATGLICRLTKDESRRVISSAISALGEMETDSAKSHLIKMANDEFYSNMYWVIFGALGNYKSKEVENILVGGLNNPLWYQRSAAMKALYNCNEKVSVDYIVEKLKDDHPRVRRDALDLILISTPIRAERALTNLLNDEDFETRFYAKQAIELIEEKKKEALN